MIYGWIIGGLTALDLGIKSVVEGQEDGTFPRELPNSRGMIKLHKNHNAGFPFGFLKERPELVKTVPLMVISAMAGALCSLLQGKGKTAQKLGLSIIIDVYKRQALGYGQSVTVGYVSALDREVRVSNNSTRTLLQTDAAINPGNSGGALLNMKGEVVGINAAKYSSTEVEGIGYAIPISKAQDIMSQLMNRKTMNPVAEEKRGYLGIQGTSVDEEAANSFGMPRGVYIYKILDDGAAAVSDLREKDIITKVDGQSVKTMPQLQELLACYRCV